jgi:REP-associated tyrosine transposase
MQNKHHPLNPGYFYHIFNRGNNRENLFYKPDNYIYFLKKYDQYLNDYLETYAFCLLPNHFHLLVRVKELRDLPGFENPEGLSGARDKDLPGLGDLEGQLPAVISKQFSKFFNAYAKAINKQQNRVGSLFQKNFKRIQIGNNKYITNLIYYIHANPQIHELIDDFRNWPYSSYGKFLEARKSHLKKKDVLNWFGGINEYKTYHSMVQDMKKTSRYQIED